MMRILVTGGGGFLGRHIVAQLLERGDEVTTIARGDYPDLRAAGARTLRGDLCDRDACMEAVKGQDAVIHTAAHVGMWGAREDFWRGNVLSTSNLLDACREQGVGRLVFTSTPSVTFDGTDACGADNTLPYPDHFMTHYPETKAQAERLVLEADSDALRTTALRPHLIWGPGDPHLIPRLIDRARRGRLRIVGDGTNTVDLTYIDNAAQAHLDALSALEREANSPRGQAYFISNDEPVALWPWINALLTEVGVAPITRHVPFGLARAAGAVIEGVWRALPLAGEPPMTRFIAAQLATSHWYDMAPARRDLGYVPRVSMEEGLARLLTSLRQSAE